MVGTNKKYLKIDRLWDSSNVVLGKEWEIDVYQQLAVLV